MKDYLNMHRSKPTVMQGQLRPAAPLPPALVSPPSAKDVVGCLADEEIMSGREYVPSTKPGEPGLYFRRDLAPGTFAWAGHKDDYRFLNFVCPCGCSVVSSVMVFKGKKQTDAWLWNGDEKKPVLSPSIFKKFGCRWHGFLGAPDGSKPGVWTTC